MDLRIARLPYTRPGIATARKAAFASMVLGAACAALPSVLWLDEAVQVIRRCPFGEGIMVTTTAGYALFLLWFAVRAETTAGAVVRCVVGGAGAGILNSATAFSLVVFMTEGNPPQAIAGFVVGGLIGGIFGAPLGSLFGLAFLPLVVAAKRRNSSIEHADVLTVASGLWLAGVSAACVMVASQAPTSLRDGIAYLGFTGAVLGSLLASVGAFRLLARRLWLSRVCGGKDASWVVAPLGSALPDTNLMRVVWTRWHRVNGVLIRRRPQASGEAYRDRIQQDHLALVALPTTTHSGRCRPSSRALFSPVRRFLT